MARPNRYNKDVEPYLSQITEMALTMTEAQIAQTLGVSLSSWKRYKKDNEPLRSALKKGRKDLVTELRSTLIKKAKGFNYEEKKIVKEHGVIVREEIYVRASTPDVAALNLLLKNYDKDNWANDPQALELRRKEIAISERRLENSEW